jgi:uncharacterized protein YndB with AHSA1/START domain
MIKPQVSDQAVKKATGRDWRAWRAALDKERATQLTHSEIAALVHRKFKVGPWWSQMVTVGYEQIRGLRELHQKPGGFEISRSRTIAAPIDHVYRAWQSPTIRRRWLKHPEVSFSTANANKSLRFAWIDGQTRAQAQFLDKGSKTSVTVTHSKLADATAAARMKKYWSEQLDKLALVFKDEKAR